MAVTWSLAVEEQFYLTVPWIIRKVRRNLLVFVMIAVVAGAPLLRLWFGTPAVRRFCLLCTDAVPRGRPLPRGVGFTPGPEHARLEFSV
jgi:peptidoglycan/LPS O-acetylase OafA/YrhL